MIAPARWVAFEALAAINAGADLAETLARTRDRLDDERDRALAAAIVIGTLRWRARLDYVLSQASSRPLASLDAVVLEILRLSLFQLFFLTRVPASAVVDDAVSMTRRARKTSASGFVNGVLRTASRRRSEIALPPVPDTLPDDADRAKAAEALAIGMSHPLWLVERWIERFGLDATRRWLDFDNAEAPLTLRANLRRQSRDELCRLLRDHGVESEPTRFAPAGLVVTAGNPLKTDLADTGRFLVQDEASQLVPLLLGVRPGDRVLDACAAPGGKTLAIADALEGTGWIVAADLRPRRVSLLRRLLGAHDVAAAIVVHDLARGLPFGAAFDRVLVDAPCTGLGTIRRDVDIRWRRTAGDVAAAAERQIRMLTEAAAGVRPGGRLVYATCSSEPEENQAVVRALLDRRRDFYTVDPEKLQAEGVPAELLEPSSGWLVTRPDRHGLEAFFGAALERSTASE
jgi:16S rRNA (cytosine967-C5)-methyltransferase